MTNAFTGSSQAPRLGAMATTETTVDDLHTLTDLGLLILRIGIGAAMVQAGLIKAFDFGTTVGLHGVGRLAPADDRRP